MGSSVIQWIKSMLIIYFDAQIVPVLLVEALPTYFCVLLTCSHHSLIILFWQKMFQAHLVLFLPRPGMSHFSKESKSHLVEIGI